MKNNKGKILICTLLPPPLGGIATWTNELKKNESLNSTFDISYFDMSNKNRKEGHFSTVRRIVDGFKVIFGQLAGFRRTLVKENPKIVHICSSGGLAHLRDILFICISKFFRKRVVLHLHYGCADELYKWIPLTKSMLSLCVYLVDRVACFDERMVRASRYEDSKFKVVKNGLDCIGGQEKENKKKEFVFVGWIVEPKGIIDLINAWKSIENYNGWKLKIIGPCHENFESTFSNLCDQDNINYIGSLSRDEVLKEVSASSVFVLPTHTEGLPFSVIEAMMMNCALITTDVGGLPSLYNYNAQPGIKVKAKCYEELNTALTVLINNDELVLDYAANARALYETKFNADSMTKELMECWIKM